MASTRIRKGPSGCFASIGGASDEGVTSVRWVDPNTTLDPSEQTGSAIAPFSTLAAALASLQLVAEGTTVGTIICSDADYVDEPLTWTATAAGQRLEVVGFGNARGFGQIRLAGEAGAILSLRGLGNSGLRGPYTLVSSIDGYIYVTDCVGAEIDAENCALILANTQQIGDVIANRIEGCTGCTLQQTVELTNGITAFDTTIGGELTAGDVVRLIDCICSSVVHTDTATSHFGRSTEYRAGLDYSVLDATDCIFTGQDADQVQGGFARIQGGRCDLRLTSDDELRLFDVVFDAAGEQTANIVASGARIEGCVLNGDLTISGTLQIDTTSYQEIVGSFVISIGTLTFMDSPLWITLSIVVPAVAADAVGYVNTSLVGTNLEDVFQPNEPVLVCPQTDLVAAGAGGGFINARISAANTLRCAFNGALAGGAANFTVARGR